MRANIKERLSDDPITTRARKSEKTTWIDIALGIYFGGLALMLTSGVVTLFFFGVIAKLISHR